MKVKGVGNWLVLGCVLSGCTQGLQGYKGRQVNRAPQSEEEVGVLVRGADSTAIAHFLSSHSEVTFRTLSEADQFYELYGASTQEVMGALPQAQITANEFFPAQQKMAAQGRFQLLAQSGPAGLDKCKPGESTPLAVINVLGPQPDLKRKVLERNTTVELASEGSQNVNFPDQPLKKAWIILSPRGANEEERMVAGEKLELKLDSLGAYGVALVVQDQGGFCHLDILEFAVTANAEYAGSAPAPQDLDLSKVGHLGALQVNETWTLSQGNGVTIAVIDSGVNFNHPALRQNMALNAQEVANGEDDDHNGFVDDITGWDFALNDNSPFDDVGHGSHVAGLAASSAIGLAKQAHILAIKALGAFGGDAGSVAAGLRYALARGAKIINLSLGAYGRPHPEVVSAINLAEAQGVLVVTAAGNGHPLTGMGVDIDSVPHFPASLPNPNILSVAAKGADDQLTLYSNYGAQTVDVAAPGGDRKNPLFSCFLENTSGILFEGMDGTSMATPIVSGLAAQVWSRQPSLTALQVKELIMNTGRSAPQLKGLIGSERWVDPLATLQAVP